MDNREMISRISKVHGTAKSLSLTLVPVMQNLNTHGTSDEIRHKNMDLADSIMKLIQDSEELQYLLQKEEELV